MDFIGLHNHTDYSNIRILDSINSLRGLIDRYSNLGYSGVAITDHECLGSHIRALQYVKDLKAQDKIDKNFKLILGNEVYLCRNGLTAETYQKGKDFYYHFILLAKDVEGYQQLKELSTRAWNRSFKHYQVRVPTYYKDFEEVIGKNPGHLILSTACLGSYGGHHFEDDTQKTYNFYKWCRQLAGDDFYLEIQPNEDQTQIRYNKFLVEYGKEQNLPVIVTTDAHYLVREERFLHEAFLKSNDGEREVGSFYNSTYVMDEDDLKGRLLETFSEEQTNSFISNTLLVGEKCEEFDLSKKQVVPRVPIEQKIELNSQMNDVVSNEKYPYINKYLSSSDKDDRDFIVRVLNFLVEKNIADEKHINRIEAEMDEMWESSISIGDSLSAYMRTVSKIVDLGWTKAETLIGVGRGSAGSQLNAYALNIIQTDPLAMPIEQPNWRFLSRERPDLPDIDVDSCASMRNKFVNVVIDYFKSIGGDAVAVCTYGTESSKAALITSCRGLGYDNETGAYLSSLIPSDRGKIRELSECYYGNKEKDFKPIGPFVKEMDANPDIWEVAQRIEGLICKRGRHAAGIVCTNEPLVNYTALMRSPDGQLTTQLELHDAESVGLLKFDCLTTDALDRIKTCLGLLVEYGYVEDQGSLKANYDKYLNPSAITFDEPKMWDMLDEEKIVNVFQFDSPQGSSTIRAMQPRSLLELSQGNTLMRLMPEGRKTTPLEDFIRFKKNINLFKQEIEKLKCKESERQALYDIILPLQGVCDSQESLMILVMDKRLTNFSMLEANKLRKVIAKKKLDDIEKIRQFMYEKGNENGCSQDVLDYMWNVQISRQLGYSFSMIHTISYSIIAVQQMNLAYYYPVIFWNTANLIVDSAGFEGQDGSEDEEVIEPEEIVETPNEEENDDEDDAEEEVVAEKDKKKVKRKTVDYGKIATAIGTMRSRGVDVRLPDINKSGFTFRPDVEENVIYYGIKGISKINSDLGKEILQKAPYTSLADFMNRVKTTKPQMLSLIKSGCFDEIEGRDRFSIMQDYIDSISDKKKRLTLQNMQMLIDKGFIPEELSHQIAVYKFTKYLRKAKVEECYQLDSKAIEFFEKHYDMDLLQSIDGKVFISQTRWDKIYKAEMEAVKKHIAAHPEMLDNLNGKLYQEVWDQYAKGSVSKWEMDSVSFYYHKHELEHINQVYNIRDFSALPDEPEVDKVFYKGDKPITLYKLNKIAGTVIDKDKTKHIVTLLTAYGVVKVKFYCAQFAKYDKQIAEKDSSGKKRVVEKSWFSRGNKLMILGIKRNGNFVPKCYRNSEYSFPVMIIDSISDNGILTCRDSRLETD